MTQKPTLKAVTSALLEAMNAKAVIFDLDGTLVDNNSFHLLAWKKYLENNMDIDMLAKKVKMAKKEKVLVQTARIQFIVCKDGSICNVTTDNADEVDPVFKKEAERLIAISPQWKPASQDGRNVKAYRIQPITLYLTKD